MNKEGLRLHLPMNIHHFISCDLHTYFCTVNCSIGLLGKVKLGLFTRLSFAMAGCSKKKIRHKSLFQYRIKCKYEVKLI